MGFGVWGWVVGSWGWGLGVRGWGLPVLPVLAEDGLDLELLVWCYIITEEDELRVRVFGQVRVLGQVRV